MATQFSKQGTTRPSPKWYRKLENIMIVTLIPAATYIIQSWGFSNEKLVLRINLIIVVALGAIIKAIGMALIDPEDNYVSNLTVQEQDSVEVNPEKSKP